jgi:hypothetical protein
MDTKMNIIENVFVIKKPTKTDDPKYYVKYYHEKNNMIECECGQTFRRMYKSKHVKLQKHHYLLDKKQKAAEAVLLCQESMGN